MKLIVIGSSSSGNGYALVSGDGEILLIEAGIRPREMRKAIDYRIGSVSGCIVSHAHGDHAAYVSAYSKLGIRIGCNEDVAQKKAGLLYPLVMHDFKKYAFGSYHVTPLSVKHDVPNFAYVIHHPEMGSLLFATDTYTLPCAFRNIAHFLIEANYSDHILSANLRDHKITRTEQQRLLVSHMSLDNCVESLRLCQAERAKNIVLIHLSSRNSNAAHFRTIVASEFAVPTYIADKGLTINL